LSKNKAAGTAIPCGKTVRRLGTKKGPVWWRQTGPYNFIIASCQGGTAPLECKWCCLLELGFVNGVMRCWLGKGTPFARLNGGDSDGVGSSDARGEGRLPQTFRMRWEGAEKGAMQRRRREMAVGQELGIGTGAKRYKLE